MAGINTSLLKLKRFGIVFSWFSVVLLLSPTLEDKLKIYIKGIIYGSE